MSHFPPVLLSVINLHCSCGTKDTFLYIIAVVATCIP